MELKGTQSEKNIQLAFAGESQARNKYTYYADLARRAGLAQVAVLFQKMAANECEHARVWFRLLHGEEGETADHLLDAAASENSEWKFMYPAFAATARAEGLDLLANTFEQIAAIENDHERRFLEALLALNAAPDAPAPAEETSARQQLSHQLAEFGPKGPFQCIFCGSYAQRRLDQCPLCGAVGAYEPS